MFDDVCLWKSSIEIHCIVADFNLKIKKSEPWNMLEICQNDFVSTYCGIVKHLCKGGMKVMLDGIP